MGKTGAVPRVFFCFLLCFFASVVVLLVAATPGTLSIVYNERQIVTYPFNVRVLVGNALVESFTLAVGVTRIWRVWMNEEGQASQLSMTDRYLDFFQLGGECMHLGGHNMQTVKFEMRDERMGDGPELSARMKHMNHSEESLRFTHISPFSSIALDLHASNEYIVFLRETTFSEAFHPIVKTYELRLNLKHCQSGLPYDPPMSGDPKHPPVGDWYMIPPDHDPTSHSWKPSSHPLLQHIHLIYTDTTRDIEIQYAETGEEVVLCHYEYSTIENKNKQKRKNSSNEEDNVKRTTCSPTG